MENVAVIWTPQALLKVARTFGENCDVSTSLETNIRGWRGLRRDVVTYHWGPKNELQSEAVDIAVELLKQLPQTPNDAISCWPPLLSVSIDHLRVSVDISPQINAIKMKIGATTIRQWPIHRNCIKNVPTYGKILDFQNFFVMGLLSFFKLNLSIKSSSCKIASCWSARIQISSIKLDWNWVYRSRLPQKNKWRRNRTIRRFKLKARSWFEENTLG